MKIRYFAEKLSEVREASEHYRGISENLSVRFHLALNHAVESIISHPLDLMLPPTLKLAKSA